MPRHAAPVKDNRITVRMPPADLDKVIRAAGGADNLSHFVRRAVYRAAGIPLPRARLKVGRPPAGPSGPSGPGSVPGTSREV